MLLAPLGLRYLGRQGNRRIAVALAVYSVLLLVNASTWYDWIGGWTWRLRLLVPALPALAILAAAGLAALGSRARRWIAGLLFLGGLVWAIPCVVTDLFAGYGGTYADTAANFTLSTYPPIGARKWIDHWFASSPTDSTGVDILWFRLAHSTGGASLLVSAALLVAAGLMMFYTRSLTQHSRPAPLAAFAPAERPDRSGT